MKSPTVEAAASAPAMGVAGMTFLGYQIADWVQVVALAWLVMQIGYFVWSKFIRKNKE